eukprot:gene24708-10346_t
MRREIQFQATDKYFKSVFKMSKMYRDDVVVAKARVGVGVVLVVLVDDELEAKEIQSTTDKYFKSVFKMSKMLPRRCGGGQDRTSKRGSRGQAVLRPMLGVAKVRVGVRVGVGVVLVVLDDELEAKEIQSTTVKYFKSVFKISKM